jgi:hypothetical protein
LKTQTREEFRMEILPVVGLLEVGVHAREWGRHRDGLQW